MHNIAILQPSLTPAKTVVWLLSGDIAIEYQAQRDLLDNDNKKLQVRISQEGWGKRFLLARNQDGSWGNDFCQPRWTCSHYTLLDLKMLGITNYQPEILPLIEHYAAHYKARDGGVGQAIGLTRSDVCINGMFLNYACYFGISNPAIQSIVDFILNQQMRDGGFNCMRNRSGAKRSSLHSTLSVLEGFTEYVNQGYRYRAQDIQTAVAQSQQYLLVHRLCKSKRTGEIIRPAFNRLCYPARWRFNILRAMDYFRAAKVPWDERMSDAIAIILSKRREDGRWLLQAPPAGEVHFNMEKTRQPSRWVTLLALRILKHYGLAEYAH